MKKKCMNCGLVLLGEEGNLCKACKAYIEEGKLPKCRSCGKEASKEELDAWEARRGYGKYYGAGRYLCPECRIKIKGGKEERKEQ